jgi:hypothetical protein
MIISLEDNEEVLTTIFEEVNDEEETQREI